MSSAYVNQKSISTKGISRLARTDLWVRNTEWLPLNFSNGDEKAIGLFAIFPNEYNAVAVQATVASGSVVVNWGDGTSNTVASNTTAQKSYDYNAFDNSTLTSKGYKQVIITITPTVAGALRNTNLSIKPSIITSQTSPAINWLEFKVGGPGYLVPLSMGGTGTTALGTNSYPMMENFEVLNGTLTAQNLNNTFNTGFPSLKQFRFVSRGDQTGVSSEQFSGTFLNCFNLVTIDFETPNSKLVPYLMSNTFYFCKNLKRLPKIDYSKAFTLSGIFQFCTSLEYIDPIITSASLGTISSTWFTLNSLQNPIYIENNSTQIINLSGLKYPAATVVLNSTGRILLQETGNYCKNVEVIVNGSNVSIENMFSSTKSIEIIKFSGTGTITNAINAFSDCENLTQIIGNFNLNGSANGAFLNCYSLMKIPSFTTTGLNNTFQNCNSLREIGTISNPTNTDLNVQAFCFSNCYNLEKVPSLYSTTVGTSTFGNCVNLKEINVFGMHTASFSISNSKLDGSKLNQLFVNLGIPTAARTLTITGSQGAIANANITKTSVVLTAGNTTFLAAASQLLVGMQVTGTGISTARNVTFQDATDTVTLTGHGIPNGKLISFTAITSTTGIVVYTPYYVVNATTDTFQLSLTEGGSPIALTTDGTGTMIYQTLVTAIDTGTNTITIDVPISASGTQTLTFRNINTQLAVMKRWTISG